MNKEYYSIDGYPFEQFTKDYDCVNTKINAQETGDFMSSMMIVRNYMKETYSNESDQVQRGAAIMMCLSFLAKHIKKLNYGPFAVTGECSSLYSEPLFRALYEVVASYALDDKRPEPTLGELVRRATIMHKEGI